MAAWGALIKTVLPYVADVIAVAIPAFTAKKDDKKTAKLSLNRYRNFNQPQPRMLCP